MAVRRHDLEAYGPPVGQVLHHGEPPFGPVVVEHEDPTHRSNGAAEHVPGGVDQVGPRLQEVGVRKAPGCDHDDVGRLGQHVVGIHRRRQPEVHPGVADLGLQPVDETSNLPLTLAGPGRQDHLATNPVLGLEQDHVVASFRAGPGRLQPTRPGTHHHYPLPGP